MTATPLLDYISGLFPMSKQDADLLTNCFQHSKHAKDTVLEPVGKIASNLYFILEGYVRIVQFDDGAEITTHITGKNNFITAFHSFNSGVASKEMVKCISGCEVLSITKADYHLLTDKCTLWSAFCKYTYEKVINSAQKRTADLLALSAEKRYLKLLNENADFVQHVPIQYLASYIGIKPESLSRIRKKITS
jgi:CRP/FNR family transcriptional regulator, anaerobic regulatory protein